VKIATPLLLAAVLAYGVSAGAQTAPAAPAAPTQEQQPEDPELKKLMAILAEETAVATKTRMNGDFVPGIVTVLHGEELEALGFETAWEALSLVPGLQAVRDASGTPSLIVRGLDFPFNSGNVKVLVNGVPLSRESAGINGIALQVPVQQIERIEIIRGPGSVVYGDFAFNGLVNVVTSKRGRRAFLRGGGDEAKAGGAQLQWGDSTNGSELSLAGALWSSADAPVNVVRSAEERRGWGSLLLRQRGFAFAAEAITRDLDDTSAAPGNRVTTDQTHWAVQARYERELRPALRGELRGGFLDNRFDTFSTDFEGSVAELGVELRWEGWRKHAFLFGASYSLGEIDLASFEVPPAAPPAGPPPPGSPPPRPPSVSLAGEERNVFGVTLQDQLQISGALALTAGARFDSYSDVGRRVTPRLSLVFRASERNILKLQHAEGFRAPTFFELYAPNRRLPDLSFEINGTTELNYVHRRPRMVGRATLFRSQIRDMIFVRSPGLFDNSREARAHGFELEWEQQLGARLKLLANVSWSDETENRNLQFVGRRSPVTAEWLSNLAALWRATPRTLVAARWNHVGDRGASAANDAYDLVDLTATRRDLFGGGLRLRAGVKNLLNHEVRYYAGLPNGVASFRFPRRTFWVELAWAR
jgi:iron complex outermembrane receptor protein